MNEEEMGLSQSIKNFLMNLADPAFIWSRGPEDSIRLTYCNRYAEGISGNGKHAKPGQCIEEFPAFKTELIEKLRETWETGKPIKKDVRHFFDASGKNIWMSLEAIKLSEDSIIVLLKNIDEQKKIHQELKQSESRFQAIFSATTDAHVIADIDGNMIMASSGAAKLFGYPSTDAFMKVKTWDLYLIKGDRSKAVKSIQSGGLTNRRTMARKANGELFPGLLSGAMVTVRGKQYLYGHIKDISDYERLQSNLSETEFKYRKIINALTDGIVLLKSDLRIAFVNPSANAMLFTSETKPGGKKLKDLIQNALSPALIEMLADMTERWVSFTEECDVACADKTCHYEINGINLGQEYVLQIRDLTDLRQLEKRRKHLERMEMTSMIASQIAHDFNNLLSPIVGIPEIIKSQVTLEPKLMNMLNIMQVAGDRLTKTNQQLLSLAKFGSYEFLPVDLNRIIKDDISLNNSNASIVTNMTLSSSLPSIMGDETQLARMVLNIVNNAFEVMTDGGNLTIVTEHIVLEETLPAVPDIVPGAYVAAHFHDTGPGIDPELSSTIFEPFFSTKSQKDRSGLGLGLNIVSEIVRNHKGFLGFTSNKGKGAIFHVYFPVSGEAIKPELHSNPKLRGSESILAVDDNTLHLQTIKVILEDLGYSVETVETGVAAIEACKHKRYDLVLLDMIMDNMDGADVYKNIIDIVPDQKAIIVTAFAESARIKLAMKLGVRKCLSKPLNCHILASNIRQIMDADES
jgi:PAS domain S-box-containing protein